MVRQNTDKQCSSHWYKIGHRCGSHDSTSTGVRTRGGKSGGGHEGNTCCRTTSRRASWRRTHRHEARWRAKRGDCGSCELWRSHARGQWRRRQPTFKSSSELAQADGREDRCIPGGRGKASQNLRGEKAASLSDDAPMELTQAVERTATSHAPVEDHEESLAPKRQRGRPATHVWPSPGSPEYTGGCLGCDGRSCKHLTRCQQRRRELGLSASSSSG